MFAVAAFYDDGALVGGGIGEACEPVETLNPLPLPLCWALLARTALALGWPCLAGQVGGVYVELVGDNWSMGSIRAALVRLVLTGDDFCWIADRRAKRRLILSADGARIAYRS